MYDMINHLLPRRLTLEIEFCLSNYAFNYSYTLYTTTRIHYIA